METLGIRIRKAREALSLSQVALAKMLGLTPGAVRGWECGTSNPTAAKLEKIAEALGCSVGYLLGERSAPSVVVNGEASAKDNAQLFVGHHISQSVQGNDVAAFVAIIESQQATIARLVATIERLMPNK